MRKLVLVSLVNAFALFVAAYFLPGISAHSPLTFLWAGIVLGLVNLIIRPVLLLLTLPFSLVTLGLFILVVNTWMVMLTASFLPGFRIHGFITAFLAALIVSLFNWLLKDLYRKAN